MPISSPPGILLNTWYTATYDSDSQAFQNYTTSLNVNSPRQAQRKTLDNKKVTAVTFKLSKNGSPTGSIYCRIRKVSDDSIIQESDAIDAATLTTVLTDKTFNFSNPVTINEEVRISCEYPGGDVNNYIWIACQNTDVKSGELRSEYTTSWTDFSSFDMYYILFTAINIKFI